MLIVAVIIHSRYQNLVRWINCWKKSYVPEGTELIIIHNDNGNSKMFRELCEANGVKYILRRNEGFDIGAMQDVFNERLDGFPIDWEYLLWVTDDVIPMVKHFVLPFLSKMKKGVGVAAMHISNEYDIHVRTGCFCISKAVSKKIIFPSDPVLTKKDCYLFEHRGGMNTFTNQIRRLGLSCEQVSPLQRSPMYDTEYWKRNKRVIPQYHLYNREKEHHEVFK